MEQTRSPLHYTFSLMIRSLFVILILAALAFRMDPHARAQEPFGTCEDVKTSTEAMACVKSKMEKAQSRLNKRFESIAASLEPEQLEEFRTSQSQWLKFRSRQCALESVLAPTESLQTLYRLDCVHKLTRDRITHLSAMQGWQDTDQPREFGVYPKWVNKMEAKHPEIFWEFKSAIQADLDCDGRDEYILPGIDIRQTKQTPAGKAGKNKDDNSSESHFTLAVAVGILNTELSGRLKSEVFEFPVRSAGKSRRNHEESYLCAPDIEMAVVPKKISSPGTRPPLSEAEPAKSCTQALQIYDKLCQPVVIFYQNGAYRTGNIKGQ